MTVPAGFVDPLPVADIVAMRATSMPLRYARCREVVGLVRLWRAEWDAPGKAQPAPALDLFFRKWT
jgi:hypothetical protein